MDLSRYSGRFLRLYNDRFDVQRYVNEVDEHGATRNVRLPVPSYQDCWCLISPEQADDASPRPVALLQAEQYVSIHCSPGLKLLKGDYLVLRKIVAGKVAMRYYGTIGEPKVYPTHIKATMKIDKSEVGDG